MQKCFNIASLINIKKSGVIIKEILVSASVLAEFRVEYPYISKKVYRCNTDWDDMLMPIMTVEVISMSLKKMYTLSRNNCLVP